ncbi:MAG: ABC transporter permease [Dehalococcoidia bacterium]
MAAYLLRRILLLIPTLLGISVVLFIVIRVLPPQDAIDQIIADYGANDPTLKQDLEQALGMDGSMISQYLAWLGDTLRGDLGTSLHTRRPIIDDLKWRIPISFELSLIGLFFTWLISFPLGIASAVYQDRLPDYALRGTAYLINSIPTFALAILLITWLAVEFNYAPPPKFTYPWDDFGNHVRIMLLPTILIGVGAAGALIRFTRTILLEVLRQDYIRTARAKGLRERRVLYSHALRNVAIPFLTIIGAAVPGLLTSSVLLEQIFLLPGMGRYLVEAAARLDYPVIMATTMMFTLIALIADLAVDCTYALVDPRISYRRGPGR